MKPILLTTALLLAAQSARAQDAAAAPPSNSAPVAMAVANATDTRPRLDGPLSLEEAVQVALKNSPLLRGAQAEIDIAAAQIKAAQAARKLSVSATTFLTAGSENGPIYSSPDGVSPVNLFAVPRGPFANQNVMFMLPVLNGGRLGALTKQAQSARGAAQADAETTKLDVILETKTAYRQVLLALELQKVAVERQRATSERLQNDRAALAAGRVPELYVLRDQAEDADAGQEVTNAARDVEMALVMLRAVMGVQSESAITVSDSLETVAPASNSPADFATALENRPELRAARARLESARQGDLAARGASKFQASLMGMGDLNRSRGGGSAGGASVGVIVGVPILDGGLRRAGREEARAGIAKTQADFDRLQIEVEREVSNAKLTLGAAQKNVAAAQSGVMAAQEAFRVAGLRYEGGRATNAEVLDALAALTRAQGKRARALFEVQNARDELERAMGSAF
ncbi:Outer membrane protein TolC [Abditibacterium utsteinense]|uniref:Outer membrane protein TolC n=1 Tax=Abditibacterium utsteinense TaxID=1960156 RepID=A0A2S8SPU1_9BACT|nr:TolC family protein [Abditibacterium utsteinense]PQV62811.1 Outer membrane protein TolC [Abditibacterium utsteinense]